MMKPTMMFLLVALGCRFLWAQPLIETGFAEFEPGPFQSLEAEYGRWQVVSGRAEINARYYHSDRHCLHIFGGTDTTVEFIPAVDQGSQLTFLAERWTARAPFKFRVTGLVDGQWQELYNGDRTIRVGARFLTPVCIDLPHPAPQRYRFICSAPEEAGILIDDFACVRPTRMKVLSVTTRQWVVPALIGKPANPVLQIKIETQGNLEPLRVNSLRISTAGTTDLKDIDLVQIYYTGAVDSLQTDRPFGPAMSAEPFLLARGDQPLSRGANYFWVSYRLRPEAPLSHRVDAACEKVVLSSGRILEPDPVSPPVSQRIGVALRQAGQDGSHTYRIPGLATTNRGTLIAVYDVRWRGSGDLPGDIDVGMSRSTDGGQSWEPMKIIMDMGSDPKFRYDGIGDPAVLVDRATNTIWVAAVWSHGNRGWHGSQPGLDPDQTGQLTLVSSTDDGLTWSEPVTITRQVKDPNWCFLLQGPGKGITMRDGTLVFAAQYQDTPANRRMPYSTIIYSRDHGLTWQIGTGAKPNTTEAQVVELNDGSLMLNMRDNRNRGDQSERNGRSVYITRDMGRTWTVHPTSRGALPEPTCMASLIRFSSVKDGDDRNLLLFSNPDSKTGRHHMTIKASLDEGMSWPQDCQLLLYERPGYGYSCMTRVDDQHVGILYEGVRELYYEKVHIREILPRRCFEW